MITQINSWRRSKQGKSTENEKKNTEQKTRPQQAESEEEEEEEKPAKTYHCFPYEHPEQRNGNSTSYKRSHISNFSDGHGTVQTSSRNPTPRRTGSIGRQNSAERTKEERQLIWEFAEQP